MAFAIWISAWLVFIFKLAIIATASLAFLATLPALFGAAAKALRMHPAPGPTAPTSKVRHLPSADSKKE
ncbi:hypothetical protein [Hoeflea prorocentri]|uniref:Uncharacterized protein n=1 Tax=Hoeflea prorocentri TaxID=1922333 RepID=A0A9X3UP73_9HYPH|nr:hypothetical protein [Hoeflea prorocentri]MCY6382864.1 hypothetical protein [Hoeflea prorocentri]MDA5400664.1 hypothetical protein [Hoeflea prorocentri]